MASLAKVSYRVEAVNSATSTRQISALPRLMIPVPGDTVCDADQSTPHGPDQIMKAYRHTDCGAQN